MRGWPAWLRWTVGFATLAALAWGLSQLSDVLSPFLAALAIAYFLNPVANALERFVDRDLARRPALHQRLDARAVAVGLLSGGVLLAVAAVLFVVVPKGWAQAQEAVASVPRWAEVVRARVEPVIQKLDLRYPEEMQRAREKLIETARTHAPELLSPVTRAIQRTFSSALSLVLTLLNLAVVPIFAVYLLYDMNRIRAGLAELVPHRLRPYVYSRVVAIDAQLSGFLRGQVTVCLILGCFYAVSLTLCGVPLGVLVGFVIGSFNLVPFMSYVLGLPLALGLSWLDDQSGSKLLAVAALFTLGQFVEGNFISPRIVGQSVGLHSVVVMLAVLIGGTLFGFLGMLLAVPVTATLSVFWTDLRDAYCHSEFFRRGQTENV